MKGYIGFDHHKIDCIIGVYASERNDMQPIYVDLQVETDFSKCSKSDDIADTVNYQDLAKICTSIAQSNKFALLETLASTVLHAVIQNFDVSWAWIRIKKPKALKDANFTVVELELYKDD